MKENLRERRRRAENRSRLLIGVLAVLAICMAGAVFLLTRSRPEPEQALDFSELPEEPDAGRTEMVLTGSGDGGKSDALSDAEGSGGILLDTDKTDTLLESMEAEGPADDEGWTHYLLLGVDGLEEGYSRKRSDAMLVLSVSEEQNRVVLSSVPRDTLVYIEGKGFDKLTNAYAYGKAALTVQTFEENFEIAVENYVTVNFEAMMKLVDLIGGVEIELTEKEAAHMAEMYDMWGQKSGLQTLDGWHALCYCRIRRIDSDYKRNDRQFRVLMEIYRKVKDLPASRYTELLSAMYEDVYTDMTLADAISLAGTILDITKTAEIEHVKLVDSEHSAPGRLNSSSVVLVDSLSDTAKRWREALRVEGYEPGARLMQIADQLEALKKK